MKNIRRKLFSQNFLHETQLVAKLISNSGITRRDLVLEIGPGQGIITSELIRHAGHVLAVEIDNYWYQLLIDQFSETHNLTFYHQDFLQFTLPRLPFKVFANIPFAIEGKVVRKLIESDNPPLDCHLVINNQLANRLCSELKPNFFSILHQPWFNFSIVHHFEPTDFRPIPNVNPVLFRFQKQPTPLLPWKQRDAYHQFVRLGYTNGIPINQNLKRQFPKITDTLHQLSMPRSIKPSHLSPTQWIDIYKRLKLI